MNFAQILLKLAEQGTRARRKGWNGKGLYLFLVTGWDISSGPAFIEVSTVDSHCEFAPFIAMRTADEKICPWLASQTDILANDWEII